MPGYVDYDVVVDPDDIRTGMLADLAANVGISTAELNEGDPLVALSEVAALRIAETRVVMADIARAAFRDSGLKIDGLAYISEAKATIESTWTMVDDAGYTIPSGSRVVYPVSGTDRVAFETTAAVTVDPGDTQATGVQLRALAAGTAANDLPAGPLVPIDAYAFLAPVDPVVSTSTSSGGVDAESDIAYLERLAAFRRRRSDRLILAEDFALAATDHPEVHRALALENYDPDNPEDEAERHVTVAVVDADGAELSTDAKDEVLAILEARREINFVGHVIDPTYTAITVAFTATALTGHDPATVRAAAIAAVESWLSPARWGGGAESPPQWRDETVSAFEVAAVLDAVTGLDQVTSVTVNGGTAPVTLAGVAPLPASIDHPTTPSTVDGTVT